MEDGLIKSGKSTGRFPKMIIDLEDDRWQDFAEINGSRVMCSSGDRVRNKVVVTMFCSKRGVVAGDVGGGASKVKRLLSEQQSRFNVFGGGIDVTGGCYPVYASEDDEDPIGFVQDYRITIDPTR